MGSHTEYACTYVTKVVCEDDHIDGAIGSGQFVMAERIDVTALTAAGLITAIESAYCISLAGAEVRPDEADPDYIEMSRIETAAGDEPSAMDLAVWRIGEKKLYLARYEFKVVVRNVSPAAEEIANEIRSNEVHPSVVFDVNGGG